VSLIQKEGVPFGHLLFFWIYYLP